MKKIFTLSFIFLFSIYAKADYWTQKANFAGGSRWGASGFSIGNFGYIGIGCYSISGTFYTDFWQYNPLTNVWTQKANFGGTGRTAAASFSINNKGYIGCGENIAMTIFFKDFWEYNATSNTWTQRADFGGTGRLAASGFSINGKGYIGTGWTGAFFKDFWEYDPLINTWTQKMDFGGMGKIAAAGFTDGTKGYLGTGADTVTYPSGSTDFWEWDPGTNIWTQKANFAGTPRVEACAFWICPYGYLGLGTTHIGSGTVSDIWKYNIATNTWTQVANFGAGLREAAAAFSILNKGYVGTGWTNDLSITSSIDFWEYTPDSTCITGIDEFTNYNLQFTITPNPAKDFIFVNYPATGNEKINLTIADARGKKAFTKQLTTGNQPLTIDISHFANGVYFITIDNGKEKVVKKLIKN